jgi:hypothetical protein
MKVINALNRIITAAICVSMLTYMSCGGDGDPGPGGNGNEETRKEEVTALLVGKTWKIQSVTVDGTDRSSLFTGLQVSFTASAMTITNPGPVWTGVSTWTFTNDDATAFRRNDNIEVLVEPTATTLKLTLTWNKTTLGSGRAGSVAGRHVFTFGL